MRYWILKAKSTGPHRYDYKKKLRPGRADNWERVSASSELAVGDRIFLWESSHKPCLAGLGEVIKPVGKFLRVRYLTSRFEQRPDIAFLKTQRIFDRANFLKPIPGTVFDLNAAQARELYRIATAQNIGMHPWPDLPNEPAVEDLESEAIEENRKLIPHLRRERNQQLAKKKKAQFRRTQKGRLYCEACKDDGLRYGKLKRDIFEVHHRLPLSKAEGPVKTKLSDLAVLCPNCHRAIHRTRPMLKVEALAKRLASK